jgi:hypothetical protein
MKLAATIPEAYFMIIADLCRGAAEINASARNWGQVLSIRNGQNGFVSVWRICSL